MIGRRRLEKRLGMAMRLKDNGLPACLASSSPSGMVLGLHRRSPSLSVGLEQLRSRAYDVLGSI